MRKLPLVGVLGVAVGLELVSRRLLTPLLRYELLAVPSQPRAIFSHVTSFVGYFAAVLGLFIALGGLGRLLLLPARARRSRAAIGLLIVPFCLVSVLGLFRPLPPALGLYLQASTLGLILLAVLDAELRAGTPLRLRLGLGLLALPLVLRTAWSIGSLHGLLDRTLLTAGNLAAVVAAASSLGCLAPHRRRLPWLALVAGVATSATPLVIAQLDWGLAARLAAYGFGLDLPLSAIGVALEGMALGAWVYAVVALVGRRGPLRLRGYGLLLIGLSGYQFELPVQLAATLVGFLCIGESLARASFLPAGAWRELVDRLAKRLGASEVRAGRARAWLRGERDGSPIELAVARDEGGTAELELQVGTPPKREVPLIALVRRGARKPPVDGDEVRTGDATFDEVFQLFDGRRLRERDRLLDDDLRPRLVAMLHGSLVVWPGRGLRCRTLGRLEPALEDKISTLGDLLCELRTRSDG